MEGYCRSPAASLYEAAVLLWQSSGGAVSPRRRSALRRGSTCPKEDHTFAVGNVNLHLAISACSLSQEALETESLEARKASTSEGKKFAVLTGEEDAMYVITGATGNTGSVVAERLLAEGEKVRVVGSDPKRLERFTQKGAQSFIGDAADVGGVP